MSYRARVPRPSTVVSTLRFLGRSFLVCALACGCEPPDTSSSSTGGSGGAGGTTSSGGTGGCLTTPLPTFTLEVRDAGGGPVPPDTTVRVMWSAGEEPPFHLDDPSTWGTLETSNVLCDVDPSMPPPLDLAVLACALWTASPTEVKVTAKGFLSDEHTYSAMPSTECNPEPTLIEIALELDPS